ncbi:MAG: LCP family protein, partial [Actinomycetota bacterium]|nr:LCP family protein [Actinomycetota bacterium]
NVHDPKSGLELRAGHHDADGETALAYVRNRTLDGTGDLGRIKRQQAFLAALVQKATSAEVLTNPARLYRFLDAATQSVTTDPELASLNKLRKLAQEVRGVDPDHVRFLTVPNRPHPADPNRVQWTAQADNLWQALRTDSPLPRKAKTTSAKASTRDTDRDSCTTTPTPPAPPAPTAPTPTAPKPAALPGTLPGSLGTFPGKSHFEVGDRNRHVLRYERRLAAAGFLGAKHVNGYFSKNTVTATKALERRAGIAVNGIVGPDTWTAANRAR